MITIDQIKTYGNLPENINTPFIEVHLGIGTRDVVEALTIEVYEEIDQDPTHTRYEDLNEAIKCHALISLLPLSNNFFLESIPGLNENGVNDRFFSPAEIDNLINRYEKRSTVLINRIKGKKKLRGMRVSVI